MIINTKYPDESKVMSLKWVWQTSYVTKKRFKLLQFNLIRFLWNAHPSCLLLYIFYARNYFSYDYTLNAKVDSEVAAQIVQLQNTLENGNMLTDEDMSLIIKSPVFVDQMKRLTIKGRPTQE